jgi:hypothetical protein
MKKRMIEKLQAGLEYTGKSPKNLNSFAHLSKGECGKGFGHPNRHKVKA